MSKPNLAPTAPLYTELPYPADGVVRTTIGRILRAAIAEHRSELLAKAPLRIADIGCGTGEITAGLAKLFPRAEIVAVDINPRSLEMARDLAAREKLNISFLQCDIRQGLYESLQAAGLLDKPFDVVTSVGVLHHLDEPHQGFRQVRRIIDDRGLFLCFMYSSFGRREQMAVKDLLDSALPKQTGFASRMEAMSLLSFSNRHSLWNGLKTLKNRLQFGPPLVVSELIKVYFKRDQLTHASDTYSNPCEHLYRFAELEQLLAATGWSFVALAEHGGLPTSPEAYTKTPAKLELLKRLPHAALYDFFAYYYNAFGFNMVVFPGN